MNVLYSKHVILKALFFISSTNLIFSAPVNTKPNDEKSLHYQQYLEDVVRILEKDPKFKEKLVEMAAKNLSTDSLAQHLDLVSNGARTKLDDLKRQEVDRLNDLVKRKSLKNGHHFSGHVDHEVDTFETKDLNNLIKKAIKDLDDLDAERRKEFKYYEMEKEYVRRKKLEHMNPAERTKAEKHHKEEVKKHNDHPKVLHPGSKDQLEEVWEEGDHMDKNDFDPKTFFKMHDVDGNGYWDENEVDALFQKELDKVYEQSDHPEDDMAERQEEMERMREHVYGEMDKNKDDLVSLDEFLVASKDKNFDNDESWKTIDDDEEFTDDEFKDFEHDMDTKLGHHEEPPLHPTDHPDAKQPDHSKDPALTHINEHAKPHQQL